MSKLPFKGFLLINNQMIELSKYIHIEQVTKVKFLFSLPRYDIVDMIKIVKVFVISLSLTAVEIITTRLWHSQVTTFLASLAHNNKGTDT